MSSVLEKKDYDEIYNYVVTSKNKLSVIVAPTASGKTTGIPVAIFNKDDKKNIRDTILVSLPTKIAAEGASSYVISKQDPKLRVDYMTREHPTNMTENNITYAVSGSVVNRLYELIKVFKEDIASGEVNLRGIVNFYIIVDEVHTGSVNNTIIMALWRYLYHLYADGKVAFLIPNLILMTATPVKIRWLPEISELFVKKAPNHAKYVFLEEKMINMRIYDAILETFTNIIKKEHNESNKQNIKSRNTSSGRHITSRSRFHILIFVPGKSEVLLMKRLIIDRITKHRIENVNIYGAYGDMSSIERDKIYEQVGINITKVIIATNIAESSITIPDVKYVIDSMKERRPGTTSGGALNLEERFITKNSAVQRAGRAGRTIEKSYYYPMMTEKRFSQLENDKPPEIETVPIHTEIITMYSNGLKPTKVLRDIVDTKTISKVKKDLVEMGMLDITRVDGKERVEVTYKGLFAGDNRQSVGASSFVWEWIQLYGTDDAYIFLLVSCIIDSNLSRLIDIPDRSQNYNSYKIFGKNIGPDSLTTVINIWNDVLTEFPSLISGIGGRRRINELEIWCKERKLVSKVILDIAKNILILSSGFESFVPEIINIDEVMPKIINVFNISHRTWKMRRFNSTGKKARYKRDNAEFYDMSSYIPFIDDGTNNAIIGISIMNTITLFVMATYNKSKYSNRKIIGPSISIEPDLYSISSVLIAEGEVRSDDYYSVRLRDITVEDIGYNRALFRIPDVIGGSSSEDQPEIKLRKISKYLMPDFIRIPDSAYKILKTVETFVDDEYEASVITETMFDNLMNIYRSIGESRQVTSEPVKSVYYTKPITGEIEPSGNRDIESGNIDALGTYELW